MSRATKGRNWWVGALVAIVIIAGAVAPAEGSIPRRLDDVRLYAALAKAARPVATKSYPSAGYRLLGHPRASAGYGLLPRAHPRATVVIYAETRVRSFNFLVWKQRLGNKELSLNLAVGVRDGPSMYQAFGYDSVNMGDPMGLENIGSCRGFIGQAAELCYEQQRMQAEGVAEVLANPRVQGSLQLAGGLAEATAGAACVGATSGLAAVPCGVGVAHGADHAWTGMKKIWTGEQQKTLTHQAGQGVLQAVGFDEETADYVAGLGDLGLSALTGVAAGRALAGLGGGAAMAESRGAGVLDDVSNSEHLDRARTLRNQRAAAVGESKATVTAGYDPKTGRIAVGCNSNPIGCAEDDVVRQLGINKDEVRFTEAIRPRTGEQVPICIRCQKNYSPNQFPPGTESDPAGSWRKP